MGRQDSRPAEFMNRTPPPFYFSGPLRPPRPVLDTERAFFADHAEDLSRRYPDRFIVIRGESILGDYNTYQEAWACATNAFYLEIGTFLIRHCRPRRSRRSCRVARRLAS